MRIILSILFFMFTSSAFACPNLDGKYICPVQEKEYPMEIKSGQMGNSEFYYFAEEPLEAAYNEMVIVDNNEHKGFRADGYWYAYSASCTENELVLTLTRLTHQFGDPVNNYKYANSYSLDKAGNLVVDRQTDIVLCKRVK